MNIYVILIAGLLVVLLVAFGNNPIEQARKRRQAECSDDPIVCAIKKHNEEKRLVPPGKAGYTMPGGGMPGNYPSSMMNSTQGAYPASPYQPNTNQPDAQNYYPPAPSGMPPSPLQQQQRLPQVPQQP